ncbi:MAG: ABC transporter substrate-binding protein [Parvularculaceae bacterium]
MKLLAIILAAAAVSPAMAKPRAVSLDYCADQYLLALADGDQIAAASRGADKDYSFQRERGAAVRRIRPDAEEVLALSPDVVLRQWGGGANAERTFGRFGARVVSLGFPEDFDGVRENVRIAAEALGQRARGEEIITQMDERLDALATHPVNTRALYVTPGGVTAGRHTMIDAIMRAAGLRNITAEEGKEYWPSLPAETLLLAPPDMVVAGFFDNRDERINYWSASRHPALKRVLAGRPTVYLSADLISCAAPSSVEAAEKISASIGSAR